VISIFRFDPIVPDEVCLFMALRVSGETPRELSRRELDVACRPSPCDDAVSRDRPAPLNQHPRNGRRRGSGTRRTNDDRPGCQVAQALQFSVKATMRMPTGS